VQLTSISLALTRVTTAGAAAPPSEDVLLTENGDTLLTESGLDILLESA
jgi:hypothetical protein